MTYWLMVTETSGQGAAGLLPVEKLDGHSEQSSWKFQMEVYLVHGGLWDCETETPTGISAAGTNRDQKATASICVTVKPHCPVHVRQRKTAKADEILPRQALLPPPQG
jgi:hypothetical protein